MTKTDEGSPVVLLAFLFFLGLGITGLIYGGAAKLLFGWETGQGRELADLKSRCEGGDSWACNEFGLAVVEGWGGDLDDHPRSEGMRALETACKQETEEACIHFARSAFERPESEADLGAGIALLEDACERGITEACGQLGEVLFEGLAYPPESDKKTFVEQARGIELLGRACEHDLAKSCWFLAQIPMVPGGVEPAIDLTMKACTLGSAHACEQLAASERGGAPPIHFLLRACELGSKPSCQVSSTHLLSGDQEGVFLSQFRRGVEIGLSLCREGDSEACFALSTAYSVRLEKDSGKQVDEDAARPTRFSLWSDFAPYREDIEQALDTFCGFGARADCAAGLERKRRAQLAQQMESAAMLRRASDCFSSPRDSAVCKEHDQALDTLCSDGVAAACNDLAILRLRSPANPADRMSSFQLLLEACNQNYGRACLNLADLPGGPRAVGRDRNELRQLACLRGYPLAC